jgi:hypothetical protein
MHPVVSPLQRCRGRPGLRGGGSSTHGLAGAVLLLIRLGQCRSPARDRRVVDLAAVGGVCGAIAPGIEHLVGGSVLSRLPRVSHSGRGAGLAGQPCRCQRWRPRETKKIGSVNSDSMELYSGVRGKTQRHARTGRADGGDIGAWRLGFWRPVTWNGPCADAEERSETRKFDSR